MSPRPTPVSACAPRPAPDQPGLLGAIRYRRADHGGDGGRALLARLLRWPRHAEAEHLHRTGTPRTATRAMEEVLGSGSRWTTPTAWRARARRRAGRTSPAASRGRQGADARRAGRGSRPPGSFHRSHGGPGRVVDAGGGPPPPRTSAAGLSARRASLREQFAQRLWPPRRGVSPERAAVPLSNAVHHVPIAPMPPTARGGPRPRSSWRKYVSAPGEEAPSA